MSTPFQNRCLAYPILHPEEVERIFNTFWVEDREELANRIHALCRSHEKLRATLEGAEAMLETMDRKQRHGCVDAACKECDR